MPLQLTNFASGATPIRMTNTIKSIMFILTVSIVFAGIRITFIYFRPAIVTSPTRRTDAVECVDQILACGSVLTWILSAFVNLYTQFLLKAMIIWCKYKCQEQPLDCELTSMTRSVKLPIQGLLIHYKPKRTTIRKARKNCWLILLA